VYVFPDRYVIVEQEDAPVKQHWTSLILSELEKVTVTVSSAFFLQLEPPAEIIVGVAVVSVVSVEVVEVVDSVEVLVSVVVEVVEVVDEESVVVVEEAVDEDEDVDVVENARLVPLKERFLGTISEVSV
jgi:hypothetical protein